MNDDESEETLNKERVVPDVDAWPEFDDMARWQQVYTLVSRLRSEIREGGFYQLMDGGSGDHVQQMIKALNGLGAADEADIAELWV